MGRDPTRGPGLRLLEDRYKKVKFPGRDISVAVDNSPKNRIFWHMLLNIIQHFKGISRQGEGEPEETRGGVDTDTRQAAQIPEDRQRQEPTGEKQPQQTGRGSGITSRRERQKNLGESY